MKAISSPTSTASGLSSEPSSPPPFELHPLNRVIFGAGSLTRLGELARELGGSRVLLVSDPGMLTTGHPQRAQHLLSEAGLEVVLFDGFRENPNTRHVDDGVEVARHHRIDLLVAVGGGSSMDCAKGINFLLTNGGRMEDYKGFGKATQPMLPSIGVPTTTGTGSEAQSYALITDESSHLKMACGDRKAAFRVAVLDPELTMSQPRTITAVTGIDALTHAIESFVCRRATPFSRMCSQTAWQYLEPHLERTLREPTDLAARSMMQLGAHFAGMAIENAMLGIAHSCANPLTAHYGIIHGTAVGLMIPHVIRFNALVAEERYEALSSCLPRDNGEPASEALARRMMHLLKSAGLPTRLSECGVSESILHLLAEEASQQWTAQFNPRPVTESDLLQVYQMAW